MRILLFEHFTAIDPEAPMAREGAAMLRALFDDFSRIPDIEPVISCFSPTDYDAVFALAPETDGLLEQYARRIEAASILSLGSGSDAVRLTGDKLAFARHLIAVGIPHPPTLLLADAKRQPAPWPPPYVCKPRDGAGSESTFLFRDQGGLWGAGIDVDRFIIQPRIDGPIVSVAVLMGQNEHRMLLPCEQQMSFTHTIKYLGGATPLNPDLADRALALAERTISVIPGLRGYIGIDMILGEQDVVLEVNPRLTTSYIGLRALAETNLAEMWLNLILGEPAPPLRWKPGRVTFDTHGNARVESQDLS